MLLPQARYDQIWPNYIGHDLVSENNGNRGETAPEVTNMLNAEYGRNLAGLGRADYAGDQEYEDQALRKYESQDDVVGSGIFDEAGAPSTIHPDLGVFADHPNLPGYISREVQFEPNEDVESLPSGADIIGIPGGGMSWGGRLIGPGTYGEHVPYRYGSQIQQPASPMRVVPEAYPTSTPMLPKEVPLRSTMPGGDIPTASIPSMQITRSFLLPKGHPYHDIPEVPTTGFAVRSRASLGAMPVSAPAPKKSGCGCYANAPQAPRRALRGFGAEEQKKEESPSWVPYVAGSALLGAAVALFWGTLAIKPGKRK